MNWLKNWFKRSTNMFFKSRLKKIEEDISVKRKNGVADSENFGNSFNIRKAKREAELATLEVERQFILDRRNNLFWRIIWNIVVPIIVSSITAVFISKIYKL